MATPQLHIVSAVSEKEGEVGEELHKQEMKLSGQAQSCEAVYFGILLPPIFGKWQQLSNLDRDVVGQAQMKEEKGWGTEQGSFVLKSIGQVQNYENLGGLLGGCKRAMEC